MAEKKLVIALLGATGNSGLRVLDQALARGHEVKALVRNPQSVVQSHPNLKVVETNIFDKQSLTSGIRGCDTVISCLGSRPSNNIDVYGEPMKLITASMRELKLTRLIAMSSWGTYRDSRSPYFVEYFFRFIIARVLAQMRVMELYLHDQCQDLDYTVIRPPGLSDKPASGLDIQVEEECPCVPQGWCASVIMMSRADVAKFILDCAENDWHKNKSVAILSK